MQERLWPEGEPQLIREGPAWVIMDGSTLYGVVWFDVEDFPPQGHVVLWRGPVGSAGILNAIFNEFGNRLRIFFPDHRDGQRGARFLSHRCNFEYAGELEFKGTNWICMERM
jgi:hypothetical protein